MSAGNAVAVGSVGLGQARSRAVAAVPVAAAIGLSSVVFALVGYMVHGIQYSLWGFGWVLAALQAAAFALVAVLGGRTKRLMLTVCAAHMMVACVVMVAATWNAARVGGLDSIWLIDRFEPRDDFNLYHFYIYPMVGTSGLEIYPGMTNAPLHWYANVQLQGAISRAAGAPVAWAGLGVNVIVGGLTAAFVAGAIERSLPTDAPLRGRHTAFTVLTCPWPIAASVIAIREIWLYCAFALALYVAMVIRHWSPVKRLVGVVLALGTVGPACFLLRAEMLGVWALMFLIATFDTPDAQSERSVWGLLRFGALAAVALLAYAQLSSAAVSAQVVFRASQYAEAADTAGTAAGEEGIVLDLARGGLATRAIVQTLWMWWQPLPKIALRPGSLYSLGLVATPLWTLGCLLVVALGSSVRRVPAMARTARRFASHLLWLAILTGMVGATSAEPRHLYSAVPLCCVLFSNMMAERFDLRALRVAQLRGILGVLGVALGCSVFTLAVFGTIDF